LIACYKENCTKYRRTVQYLVEKGAGKNIANNKGEIPLPKIIPYGSRYFVQYFIEHGTDINAIDNEGNTALKFNCMKIIKP